MKAWLKEKIRCWGYDIGWCPTCRQLITHDFYEPFASCGCGGMEWPGRPPLLERLRRWLDRVVPRTQCAFPGDCVAMKKTLHELRTAGFNKLRPGRIHLRCPRCGRKQSNTERGEDDPTSAVLIEILCDKCSVGSKDDLPAHFNVSGNPVYLCDDCFERDATGDDCRCDECRAALEETG